MTLARITELVNQLNQHKRIAVGATSPLPPFPEASLKSGEVTVKSAITAIWTWYSERMHHDLQFLRMRSTPRENSALGRFARLLHDQRHFNEHADYSRAREAQAWRDSQACAGASSDSELVEALLDELEAALATCCLVASRVRQNEEAVDAWRKHVAVSPESEMVAVLADIGQDGIRQPRLDYAVRRFKGHPALNSARTPADRASVAAVIAVELNLKPLTVKYDQVLDEFGLIKDPMGSALLLVAHGVQAAGYTGDQLVTVLREAWTAMQPGTS